MRKLLSADLYRLKKDRTFWFCMLAMSGIGVFEAVMQYIDKVRYGSEEHFLDDTLFVYMILIAICSAIFGSLFCGTDYSDGTIRNKLIVGHTRSAVYCSNWIVHVAALLLMTLAYLIPASSSRSSGKMLYGAGKLLSDTQYATFMFWSSTNTSCAVSRSLGKDFG